MVHYHHRSLGPGPQLLLQIAKKKLQCKSGQLVQCAEVMQQTNQCNNETNNAVEVTRKCDYIYIGRETIFTATIALHLNCKLLFVFYSLSPTTSSQLLKPPFAYTLFVSQCWPNNVWTDPCIYNNDSSHLTLRLFFKMMLMEKAHGYFLNSTISCIENITSGNNCAFNYCHGMPIKFIHIDLQPKNDKFI